MENSIEEITFVENKIKNTRRVFEEVGCYVFFDEDLCKAIEHILSDYKRVLKENEKLNSLIKKLEKDSKEQQWIQTVDDEYLASTDKAMYADELLSFLRGKE